MTPSSRHDVAAETHKEAADANLERWSDLAVDCSRVDPALYTEYEVKRGLRDVSGKGVLAGLTRIGDVIAEPGDPETGIEPGGRLVYRGIEITDLVEGFVAEDRQGFEETCYLLLFGDLPDADELAAFTDRLATKRVLPRNFVHDAILRMPSRDIMNAMARSVLSLYVLDNNPDDTSITNVLRQSLKLISTFPVLAVYAYQACVHHHSNQSLVIHGPEPQLSTAENILHMLRPDSHYSELEAKVLDLALVLHAEHGGGNNSSFTTHVVSSSGTDTYAAMAAALGSLKGPKHGGANLKVVEMFEDMASSISDPEDEEAITDYLMRVLNREAFDRTGLIYGMGHPVYSVSDPRTLILRQYAGQLAEEKGLTVEFGLHEKVERLAPEAIVKTRKMYKGVSANVDFYSGFVYQMLDIPAELYTPLFAVSRIVGWSAHRIEEIASGSKIIRPAYKSIAEGRPYVPLSGR
jgi:citrate synthase